MYNFLSVCLIIEGYKSISESCILRVKVSSREKGVRYTSRRLPLYRELGSNSGYWGRIHFYEPSHANKHYHYRTKKHPSQ